MSRLTARKQQKRKARERRVAQEKLQQADRRRYSQDFGAERLAEIHEEETMISDTLCDAIAEIEGYQRALPQCYDVLHVEIGKVTTVMDALRAWLDCPPSTGEFSSFDAALGLLRAEIASLDVEPLLRALVDLKASWPTKNEIEAAKRQLKGLASSDTDEQIAASLLEHYGGCPVCRAALDFSVRDALEASRDRPESQRSYCAALGVHFDRSPACQRSLYTRMRDEVWKRSKEEATSLPEATNVHGFTFRPGNRFQVFGRGEVYTVERIERIGGVVGGNTLAWYWNDTSGININNINPATGV